MSPSLAVVLSILAAPTATLPTDLKPVAPDALMHPLAPLQPVRKERAAILIHGMKLFPLRPHKALRPDLHDWQEPATDLPKTLGATFDVYAFCYAQLVPVDAVCHTPALRAAVASCKAAGYKEIVLIGHSCGGIIAREFVEAYPDAGVTKVIQVATPNMGSDLAVVKTGYPKIQSAFVESVIPALRQDVASRGKRLIPPKVEFATVVCKLRGFDGDGLVWMDAQWPDDLQRQGVPATIVQINHFEACKGPAGVKAITELAREKLTRWSPEEVEKARRVIFREEKPTPPGP